MLNGNLLRFSVMIAKKILSDSTLMAGSAKAYWRGQIRLEKVFLFFSTIEKDYYQDQKLFCFISY